MKTTLLREFGVVLGTVLLMDWALGVLCASGHLPHWVFLLLNLPFGALYVLMESSWVGTHYELWGWRFGDLGSLAVFLFVVIAQSLLNFLAWRMVRGRRRTSTTAPAIK